MAKDTLNLVAMRGGIPAGAVQVHFGRHDDCLAPRGTMMKNSLGETIAEKLLSSWEHWTDHKYADNPSTEVLLDSLIKQAHVELGAAIEVLKDRAGA